MQTITIKDHFRSLDGTQNGERYQSFPYLTDEMADEIRSQTRLVFGEENNITLERISPSGSDLKNVIYFDLHETHNGKNYHFHSLAEEFNDKNELFYIY